MVTHLLIGLAAAAIAVPAIRTQAQRQTVSPPVSVMEIDTGKLKGDPIRLAWSPDAKELYLQTAERDRSGRLSARHHVITLERRSLKTVGAEPTWVAKYWTWKSAQAAPGDPATKIAVESKQELVKATAAPMGGGLARGDPGGGAGGSSAGTGVSVEDAAAVSNQTQMVTKYTLRLKGETLGEWTNEAVVPGLTFGWAPAQVGAIAYANKDGKVTILDLDGGKQEIDGSRDALLPAWSDDGRQLAYLQRSGRKKFTLQLLEIG